MPVCLDLFVTVDMASSTCTTLVPACSQPNAGDAETRTQVRKTVLFESPTAPSPSTVANTVVSGTAASPLAISAVPRHLISPTAPATLAPPTTPLSPGSAPSACACEVAYVRVHSRKVAYTECKLAHVHLRGGVHEPIEYISVCIYDMKLHNSHSRPQTRHVSPALNRRQTRSADGPDLWTCRRVPSQ